jgi:serine/threonine protein kinase
MEYIRKKFNLRETEAKKSLKHVPSKIRWQAGDLLGQGSFGRVVKGFNLDSGETMAVKQVPLVGHSYSKEKIEALQQEIEVLSDLKHRNIVRYMGARQQKDTLNIFLEYVAGKQMRPEM